MNSDERRQYIENILISENRPVKGQDLSKELGVTRQIIVKDIAILRAQGKNIISTPKGYIVSREQSNNIRKVIAVCHDSDHIEDELKIIVKYGGTIEDVIIEHALYGEIRGMMMIKTYFDIDNFIKKLKEYKSGPLSVLTGGVHLHTISVDNNDIMNKIIKELKEKNYLISD